MGKVFGGLGLITNYLISIFCGVGFIALFDKGKKVMSVTDAAKHH